MGEFTIFVQIHKTDNVTNNAKDNGVFVVFYYQQLLLRLIT